MWPVPSVSAGKQLPPELLLRSRFIQRNSVAIPGAPGARPSQSDDAVPPSVAVPPSDVPPSVDIPPSLATPPSEPLPASVDPPPSAAVPPSLFVPLSAAGTTEPDPDEFVPQCRRPKPIATDAATGRTRMLASQDDVPRDGRDAYASTSTVRRLLSRRPG